MDPPLQDLGFDKSEYERPTQPWICGWGRDGRPCRIGPDHRGNCRATFECKPLSKNDRWFCTRTQAGGGKCAEGPLPDGKCARAIPRCQPVRTIRAQRGFIVRSVSALTVGAVLMFGGPGLRDLRNDIISPGDLSGKHAAIPDCSACHSIAGEADVRGSLTRLGESGRCLECHQISGEEALGAHGIDDAALADVSQRVTEGQTTSSSPSVLLASLAPSVPRNSRGELWCSTCHQEHRGTDWSLVELSGQRCQACHRARFSDFANGHREFVDYPDYPSADDSFEHGDHAEYEDDCTACHFSGPNRDNILTRGYEAACADCHEDEMDGEYPSPPRRANTSPEPVELLSRFNHAPHLTAPCGDCHEYGSTSDIAPIGKATCSGCHRNGGVTQKCLTCHMYHSERFELTQAGSG